MIDNSCRHILPILSYLIPESLSLSFSTKYLSFLICKSLSVSGSSGGVGAGEEFGEENPRQTSDEDPVSVEPGQGDLGQENGFH